MMNLSNTDLVTIISKKNKLLLDEINELKEMIRELKLEIILKLEEKN